MKYRYGHFDTSGTDFVTTNPRTPRAFNNFLWNKAFRTEFTWITGSLAWHNNVFLEEMLGTKPDYRGLVIDPCLLSEWKEFSVERYYRGATYNICIFNPDGIQKGTIEITLDGEHIDGNILPVFEDGKIHDVQVSIRTSER